MTRPRNRKPDPQKDCPGQLMLNLTPLTQTERPTLTHKTVSRPDSIDTNQDERNET
jgi:hypothetical protein